MTEDEKRAQAVATERRRWWELRECYSRCVQIAKDEWEHVLDLAEQQQHDTALEMRDRTVPGVRATGKEYEQDRSIPVPLLTPRDRVQFLKETSVTLFIEACKKSLPVTPEGKREPGRKVTFVVPAEGPQPQGVTEVTTSADTTAGLRRYVGRILEAMRETEKADAKGDTVEAGSGADETLDLEAEQLARAAEAAALGGGAFSLSEAAEPDVSTLGANGE